jgi:hypothetical protein
VDALDVSDDKSRDADRAKAVQFYNRATRGSRSSQGSFAVSVAYCLDKEYAEAELGRQGHRDERPDPAGPERNESSERGTETRKIANARMMTSDTTGP